MEWCHYLKFLVSWYKCTQLSWGYTHTCSYTYTKIHDLYALHCFNFNKICLFTAWYAMASCSHEVSWWWKDRVPNPSTFRRSGWGECIATRKHGWYFCSSIILTAFCTTKEWKDKERRQKVYWKMYQWRPIIYYFCVLERSKWKYLILKSLKLDKSQICLNLYYFLSYKIFFLLELAWWCRKSYGKYSDWQTLCNKICSKEIQER